MAEPAPASNAAWFDRARRVIPGGVDSPVRSFASVGGTPYTVVSGEGASVLDVEGNRYLDMVQSYGAVLLGHAHPAVTAAVAAAATHGTTFGAPTPGEVLLAEAICERVPGCEQVRLVSSGTEAAMSAVRLARGATGRDRVVKFDGCYHGHSDGLLAGGGSGVAMLGLPGSAGVSAGAVADTEVVPYNVVPDLDERVACVIVEPVAANMNLVAPAPGFLEGLRAACSATGALLIFDEVITGFRLGPAGATGWSGVTPDLWCFGKVIGGGLPVGAFGGRRDLMADAGAGRPGVPGRHAVGEPARHGGGARGAGRGGAGGLRRALVARRGLRQGPRVGRGRRWPLRGGADGRAPRRALRGRRRGRSHRGAIRLRRGAGAGRRGHVPRFFHAMLRRGVALAPGAYEVMFPGLAHDEDVLARVVEAAGEAAAEVS